MKSTTKSTDLPTLTTEIFSDPSMPVDNIFAQLWKTMKLPALLQRSGFNKRSGLSASNVVYILLVWVWLKSSSISLFSRESLQGFADAKKDVMYDFMKREDVNWRDFHTQIARKVYQEHNLNDCEIKALVVDDSVKIRRGKKVAGVSRHFDHLTGKTVKGQQLLTLAFVTETTFLPIDQDIYISKKQIQEAQFEDKRSIAAKRYKQSLKLTKPTLLSLAVKRAMSNGFNAEHLLADAWFGNKTTIRLTEECGLIALLRMKKDNTKYRLKTSNKGTVHHEMLNAKQLFKNIVRKQWERVCGSSYLSKTIDVELNLAEKNTDKPCWRKMRLLFVRGACDDNKTQIGKHDWALFFTLRL